MTSNSIQSIYFLQNGAISNIQIKPQFGLNLTSGGGALQALRAKINKAYDQAGLPKGSLIMTNPLNQSSKSHISSIANFRQQSNRSNFSHNHGLLIISLKEVKITKILGLYQKTNFYVEFEYQGQKIKSKANSLGSKNLTFDQTFEMQIRDNSDILIICLYDECSANNQDKGLIGRTESVLTLIKNNIGPIWYDMKSSENKFTGQIQVEIIYLPPLNVSNKILSQDGDCHNMESSQDDFKSEVEFKIPSNNKKRASSEIKNFQGHLKGSSALDVIKEQNGTMIEISPDSQNLKQNTMNEQSIKLFMNKQDSLMNLVQQQNSTPMQVRHMPTLPQIQEHNDELNQTLVFTQNDKDFIADEQSQVAIVHKDNIELILSPIKSEPSFQDPLPKIDIEPFEEEKKIQDQNISLPNVTILQLLEEENITNQEAQIPFEDIEQKVQKIKYIKNKSYSQKVSPRYSVKQPKSTLNMIIETKDEKSVGTPSDSSIIKLTDFNQLNDKIQETQVQQLIPPVLIEPLPIIVQQNASKNQDLEISIIDTSKSSSQPLLKQIKPSDPIVKETFIIQKDQIKIDIAKISEKNTPQIQKEQTQEKLLKVTIIQNDQNQSKNKGKNYKLGIIKAQLKNNINSKNAITEASTSGSNSKIEELNQISQPKQGRKHIDNEASSKIQKVSNNSTDVKFLHKERRYKSNPHQRPNQQQLSSTKDNKNLGLNVPTKIDIIQKNIEGPKKKLQKMMLNKNYEKESSKEKPPEINSDAKISKENLQLRNHLKMLSSYLDEVCDFIQEYNLKRQKPKSILQHQYVNNYSKAKAQDSDFQRINNQSVLTDGSSLVNISVQDAQQQNQSHSIVKLPDINRLKDNQEQDQALVQTSISPRQHEKLLKLKDDELKNQEKMFKNFFSEYERLKRQYEKIRDPSYFEDLKIKDQEISSQIKVLLIEQKSIEKASFLRDKKFEKLINLEDANIGESSILTQEIEKISLQLNQKQQKLRKLHEQYSEAKLKHQSQYQKKAEINLKLQEIEQIARQKGVEVRSFRNQLSLKGIQTFDNNNNTSKENLKGEEYLIFKPTTSKIKHQDESLLKQEKRDRNFKSKEQIIKYKKILQRATERAGHEKEIQEKLKAIDSLQKKNVELLALYQSKAEQLDLRMRKIQALEKKKLNLELQANSSFGQLSAENHDYSMVEINVVKQFNQTPEAHNMKKEKPFLFLPSHVRSTSQAREKNFQQKSKIQSHTNTGKAKSKSNFTQNKNNLSLPQINSKSDILEVYNSPGSKKSVIKTKQSIEMLESDQGGRNIISIMNSASTLEKKYNKQRNNFISKTQLPSPVRDDYDINPKLKNIYQNNQKDHHLQGNLIVNLKRKTQNKSNIQISQSSQNNHENLNDNSAGFLEKIEEQLQTQSIKLLEQQ